KQKNRRPANFFAGLRAYACVRTCLAALGLEALAAVDRTGAARLERNFRGLAAGSAGGREHLARSAKAATSATAAAAVATTATAAAAETAAGTALGGLLGVTTGLATLRFVGETALRKSLLFVSSERELRAAIDAHNGFVLVTHTRLSWI